MMRISDNITSVRLIYYISERKVCNETEMLSPVKTHETEPVPQWESGFTEILLVKKKMRECCTGKQAALKLIDVAVQTIERCFVGFGESRTFEAKGPRSVVIKQI